MLKPTTYLELVFAMQNGATVVIDGTIGVINGIAREDGSGRNWNVTLQPPACVPTITRFVRMI
jgi:hypothetical protein